MSFCKFCEKFQKRSRNAYKGTCFITGKVIRGMTDSRKCVHFVHTWNEADRIIASNPFDYSTGGGRRYSVVAVHALYLRITQQGRRRMYYSGNKRTGRRER